ncbi:hypothetical protein [Clostridium paraputrificum]|uniref:hypothetical protein n=1 Tax=Clostridium paraputrificum TaxID=29363 RepID=UPI00189EDA90|nr:hypothetical protein [Clostridium paraputrificum]
MKCITRYDMKFGDILIPARTECIVVNKPNMYTVNSSGVQLNIVVRNYDLKLKNIKNENKIIEYGSNINEATLGGIYIHTNTQSVYMYADEYINYDYELYLWQLEKIFGKNNIPDSLIMEDTLLMSKYATLLDVVEYLEEEFADWVKDNCDMRELTEDDMNEYEFYGFEVGDTTLTDEGLAKFEKKCLEYKNKLETIGFTYDFKGGLIWND